MSIVQTKLMVSQLTIYKMVSYNFIWVTVKKISLKVKDYQRYSNFITYKNFLTEIDIRGEVFIKNSDLKI